MPDAHQLTETDRQMMDRALTLADEAATIGEVPVGAVVYETATGQIVGQGSNRREIDHDPAAHAELIAIRAASQHLKRWRLSGCTLVVTLEPCPMCAGLIVNARIDRLVFAARDPKAGAVVSLMELTMDDRLNHRVDPIEGYGADQASEQLKAFFRRLRR